MLRPFPAAAMALLVSLSSACDRTPKAPGVEIDDSWVRLPATSEAPAAGYFSAEATIAGEELLSVTTKPGRIELHESMSEGNMSSMRPLKTAPFKDGKLDFEPGGKHLMLYGLPADLKPGGKIALIFRFKSAPAATIDATLVRPGGGPPDRGN